MKDKYIGVRLGATKWGGWFKIIVLDIVKHAYLAQYNRLLCLIGGTSYGLIFKVGRSQMVTKVYVNLLDAMRTK
jgi:hypothetical protein